MGNESLANAFLSCSLDEKDKKFVDFVCKILRDHQIQPFGTVGMFSVKCESPLTTMQENIKYSDFVVVCASKRYEKTHLENGVKSSGIPESIYVEIGMAQAMNKPVVIFVEKGTDITNISMKNNTQYLELENKISEYLWKKNQIYSLLNDAYLKSNRNRSIQKLKQLGYLSLGLFALEGIYQLSKK